MTCGPACWGAPLSTLRAPAASPNTARRHRQPRRGRVHGPQQLGRLRSGQPLLGAKGPSVVSTQKALDGVQLINIATGTDHTCAAGDNGKLYCWGLNVNSQVGHSHVSLVRYYTPKEVDLRNVPSGRSFVAVSAGLSSSCAVDDAGDAYCWGDNRWGRLGYPRRKNHVPKPVVTSGVLQGKHLIDIASGWAHSCAIDDAGAAYCWGAARAGRLGDGTGEESQRGPLQGAGFRHHARSSSTISTGVHHTCGTTIDGRCLLLGAKARSSVLGTGDNQQALRSPARDGSGRRARSPESPPASSTPAPSR